ncbi:MAG: PP2C family protein-serine/threonine phosphatase [Acidobacteriota bacterium]
MKKTELIPKWLLVTGLLGLALYFALYSRAYPTTDFPFTLGKDEIRARARTFIEGNGYQTQGMFSTLLSTYDDTLPILEQQLGRTEMHRRLREGEIALPSWRVRYLQNLPGNRPQERFNLLLSSTGELISFDREIPADWEEKNQVDATRAEQIVRDYSKQIGLLDLDKYRLVESATNKLANRIEHHFKWTKDTDIADVTATVKATIAGDRIRQFSRTLDLSDKAKAVLSDNSAASSLYGILRYLAIVLLMLLSAGVFLKRYHDGEVGIHTAGLIFLICTLAGLIAVGNNIVKYGSNINFGGGFSYVGNLAIASLFVFLFNIGTGLLLPSFFGWAVGEAEVRERWLPLHLEAVDAILHRKFFTMPVAQALFRGYALSALLLGFSIVVTAISRKTDIAWSTEALSSFLSFLEPITDGILNALSVRVFLTLFLITWLRRYVKRTFIAIGIAAIFSGLFLPIGSLPIFFAATYLSGFLYGLAFVRYGLLTVMAASFFYEIIQSAMPMLLMENFGFRIQGGIAVLFGLLPLVVAAIAAVRREEFEFQGSQLPSHVRRISERARMTRELEIAREVQLDLLPRTDPKIAGFDIAGICIPALEVGGDYFDYVPLVDGKLGIAIGDVSGKGVPASIYMTLTKGILQSHAKMVSDPKDVLCQVNTLVHQMIKPGNFVSMIYGVIDPESCTLIYVRAGHTPAMLLRAANGTGDYLKPSGMALGLDRGRVFSKTLEIQELDLRSGDLLVLYTDGFTEAMNERREEFGEERFLNLFSSFRNGYRSREIIEIVCEEVRRFVGHHPQHDDMTMVVIRVL